jgi:hypothetical protein
MAAWMRRVALIAVGLARAGLVWLGRGWRWAWDHTLGQWEDELSVWGKIGIGLLCVAGAIVTAVLNVLPQLIFWELVAGGFVLLCVAGLIARVTEGWRARRAWRRTPEGQAAVRAEAFRRAQQRMGRRPAQTRTRTHP